MPPSFKPNKKATKVKTLKILYLNADSLPNKLSELKVEIAAKNPDIVAVVEAKPKHCRYLPTLPELAINGYKSHTLNIDQEEGRGIICYVLDNLSV